MTRRAGRGRCTSVRPPAGCSACFIRALRWPWAADVLEADRQLRTLAGYAERVWFGLRLGGGLVLHVAPAAPGGLLRVVAWEPVVDGVGYLARLREQHVKTLEVAFSLKPRPRPCDVAADPAAYRDEAIGFALPQRLREQLTALAWPAASALAAANAVVVVADPESAEGRAALLCAGAAGPRVTALPLVHGVDWMRDTADNTPLVPAQALQALLQQIAGTA